MVKLNPKSKKDIENLVKKFGFEPDLISIEDYWDSSLNYQENRNIIENFLQQFGKESLRVAEEKYQKDEVEYYEKMAIEEEKKAIQEEVNKEFKTILERETSDLRKYYFCLERYVETILKAKHTHSLFITGKAGIGKSFTVIKTLSKNNSEYRVVLGNISPLELYHTLHEYRKGVLVFDDTIALLNNAQSMSLLMSAMWNPTNRRIVQWMSTSSKLKAPPRFEFDGKILFIANDVSKIEPIVSRCMEYTLDFSFFDIMKIMAEISKLPHPSLRKEERLKVFSWIKSNCDETTRSFDLRLQSKIETLYQYNQDKWEELALQQIGKDVDLALIKQLMESGKTVKNQVKEWTETTGKDRSTYFRKKILLLVDTKVAKSH